MAKNRLETTRMHADYRNVREEMNSLRGLRPWFYLSVIVHVSILFGVGLQAPPARPIERARQAFKVSMVMAPKVEAKTIPEKKSPPKAPTPPRPEKKPAPRKPEVKKPPQKKPEQTIQKKENPKPKEVAKAEEPSAPKPPPKAPVVETPAPQVQPEEQVILDPDLPQWYAEEIIRIIYRNWEEPARPLSGPKEIRATVFFEIMRDGHIRKGSLRLLRESSYHSLDTSALTTIREIPFFPKLPDKYPKELLEVEASFVLPE